MALIKCSECGKEISDKATNCVHCGCPIPSSPTNNDVGNKKPSRGTVSSEEAIVLLKKYKPNFLVRLFKSQGFSGFLGKFIGMTIVFVVGGRFTDVDTEVILPILGACFVLLWLGSLYPLVHLKGYCRRRHIDEAIRKDTGYMNVAINAFNALPTKKTLAYIKKLNPAAAQEIERQLAEKKK